jgi:sulfatase modifying factor 1
MIRIITFLCAVFWVAAAGAHEPAGAVLKDCDECPEVVVIPAGSFIMGSTAEETVRGGVREQDRTREQPPRRVTIANDFSMGRFHVKVSEWRTFTDATGRAPGTECLTWDVAANTWQVVAGANWWQPGYEQTDSHPVGCVDLPEAEAYVAWLSEISGQSYRIPTEAEWEYAARAGTSSLQYWSDDMDNVCAYANVSDLSRANAHGGLEDNPTRFSLCNDGYVYASPVGSFLPNQFGLYDMVGNIWDWVQDCFVVGYDDGPTDGSAWLDAPDCDRRIVRGGSWYGRNWFNRPAGRSREAPEFRASTLGVRVVRELH